MSRCLHWEYDIDYDTFPLFYNVIYSKSRKQIFSQN